MEDDQASERYWLERALAFLRQLEPLDSRGESTDPLTQEHRKVCEKGWEILRKTDLDR